VSRIVLRDLRLSSEKQIKKVNLYHLRLTWGVYLIKEEEHNLPLYDYQCPICQHVVEILITKPKDKFWCPYCERQLERVLSKPAKTPDKWRV
jgi:putative FmdB family regulatory protein